MQTVRSHPAGRLSIITLIIMLSGLAGCGGGGGSSASVPPSISSSASSVSILDQGRAAELFDDISGDGKAWLSMIDADSAIFRLTGVEHTTNSILSKLPPADQQRSITNTYSRLSYYPAASNSIADPGRYMLWGKLSPADIAVRQAISSVQFPMQGHWTCVNCPNENIPLHGDLNGQLAVDFTASTADLNVQGNGLELTSNLSLSKNNELTNLAHPSVTLNSTPLTLIRSSLLGGVFGPTANEAGVMFGVVDTNGSIISGGVAGTVP